jgi:hypothetical protein
VTILEPVDTDVRLYRSDDDDVLLVEIGKPTGTLLLLRLAGDDAKRLARRQFFPEIR